MIESDAPVEPTITRRVFGAWSVEIPATFAETFVDGSYWNGYDDQRSVSLSSVLLTDADGPVSADRIVRQLPPLEGTVLDDLPPDLIGWAVTIETEPPAVAKRALSGMLAVDGRLLIATITSNDPEWARRVWRSIRNHPTARASRRDRRLAARARSRRCD